ncbi:MAG: hypothetical protein H7Y18_15330 [Clostridiaceae bacterium]|nr:hypothetical protein [Clostridiaceae bacterium]
MQQMISKLLIFLFFLACIYYAKVLNDKKRKLEEKRDAENRNANNTILGYKVIINERRDKIKASGDLSPEQIKEALSKIDEIEKSYKLKRN